MQSTPCKHPVIVLQDVAFTDLHALVEFIYHGEVNVHQRSLSSFLKTAEVLRVSGLTQQQAEDTHNVNEIAVFYLMMDSGSLSFFLPINLQLAQIQSLANAGARTPINPHQSFTDKMVEEALFPPGASPPHINNLHTPNGWSLVHLANPPISIPVNFFTIPTLFPLQLIQVQQ